VDVERLKSSWARVAAYGDQVPQYFYAWLFIAYPELRGMFPVGMAAQRDKLFAALGHIVSSVDIADQLVPYVQSLGRDHRKFGVSPAHYAQVGEGLIATLSYFLGDAWTEELAADWLAAYGVVSQTMMAAAQEAASHTPSWWEAEVIGHERRGPDIAVITVRPDPHLEFRPGQSLTIQTHLRPRVWRLLSPANAPRRDGSLEFHVRAVAGGVLSPALVHSLSVGDIVCLGAPVGERLTLDPADPRDLLLIAGGTGLAPLRSLVEQVAMEAPSGRGRRVHLVVGARYHYELYDMTALRSRAAAASWLSVVPALSHDTPPPGGHAGDPAAVAIRLGLPPDRLAYVCGSTPMVNRTHQALAEAGWPREAIRVEELHNHKYAPSTSAPLPAAMA
jgi:NAD(P)H-flavin reductase/hemoglobin-like flavoprotein